MDHITVGYLGSKIVLHSCKFSNLSTVMTDTLHIRCNAHLLIRIKSYNLIFLFPKAWTERVVWQQSPLLSVPTGEWAEDFTFCSKTVSGYKWIKYFGRSAKNVSFTILYTSLLKSLISVSSQYNSWAEDRRVSVLAECCWGWFILTKSH